ncbi:MAG: phosphodiester glycosidase family protein [Patescibacteria group bacterium]
MRRYFPYIIIGVASFFFATIVHAATLADRLKGQILLDINGKGEAWYVYPKDGKRYFLSRPDDAFAIMRKLGIGITNADLDKISTTENPFVPGALAKRLAGSILLQVESRGEAWYVSPKDLKRYYLGRPADAFRVMSKLGLGVRSQDLAQIPSSVGIIEPKIASAPVSASQEGRSYERKKIVTPRGEFDADIITIDLSRSGMKIVSDTASDADCKKDCPAQPLADYTGGHAGAFAAIHGAYFCPPDYSDCKEKINYYFYPFYNTAKGTMINAGEVAWLQGAILVFDTNNNASLFPSGRDFVSLADFESKNKVKVRAVIGNSPALIHDGANISSSQSMDDKQRTTKGFRGGIGVKGKIVYLVIARAATVPDLASVFEVLGVENALNLDGGGSSALWWNGAYKIGPGRKLPTAVLFSQE